MCQKYLFLLLVMSATPENIPSFTKKRKRSSKPKHTKTKKAKYKGPEAVPAFADPNIPKSRRRYLFQDQCGHWTIQKA